VLSQWEQDSAGFKEMHAQKQQQLECVFYQLEENTDGGIRDNHERFLDRCEDLKSGVSLSEEHAGVLLPILALGLRVLRHAFHQFPGHRALVVPAPSGALQIPEALLHGVREEVAQLPLPNVLGQQIAHLAPVGHSIAVHLRGRRI